MRELKGDWRDLFNGFMLALDLRKMFLGFVAIIFTIVLGVGGTYLTAKNLVQPHAAGVKLPELRSFALDEFWVATCASWDAIYERGPWTVQVPYSICFLLAMFAIWGYFGGAISRIAAYEIAKDGERMEISRALKFSNKKFWSLFFAPIICVLGFLFFWFCNFAAGAVGGLVDYAWVGGPLTALFLPLAIVSGFIMVLIILGTFVGFPLFSPAVSTEGTDCFDAVSRGFSYVYSRPWHYFGYQAVSGAYGYVCIAFVFIFSVLMAHIGTSAGTAGFDAVGPRDSQPQVHRAWGWVLGSDHSDKHYPCSPRMVWREPHPYGRLMATASRIVDPRPWTPAEVPADAAEVKKDDAAAGAQKPEEASAGTWGNVMHGIFFVWILLIVGLSYGYAVSYVFSQQTMIYYILRKKVDGIEMNEVYDELEEEAAAAPAPAPAAPSPAPSDKPADKK